MTSPSARRTALAALALLLGATPLAAQVTREFGIEAIALAAHPGFAGGGVWGAIRPSGRLRLAVSALLGDRAGTAVRGEFAAHFLLDPARKRGAALYAGGGLAVESGPAGQAWLLAVLGVEGAPGGRSGWAVEFGVGGGVRLMAAWRWRSGRRS
ncbi:MAG: hypothetical protein ACHQXA_02635 [Gemmatimonadales bacterium]|jgi:hypothetical protein